MAWTRARRRWWWGALGVALLSAAAGTGYAEPAGARAFKCAVEASSRQLSAPALCDAVGQALARPVARVDDARRTRGEALQVMHSDVQWIVIWLRDGRVRAWTRVSKLETPAAQLKLLVSAASALAQRAPAVGDPCVRLDPNAGRKMLASELTYPWAALKPCKQLMVEVVDPWWLPPGQTDAGAP